MDKVNNALGRRPNEKARDAVEDITSAVKDDFEEAQGKMEEIAKEIKNQTGDAVKLLSSSSGVFLLPNRTMHLFLFPSAHSSDLKLLESAATDENPPAH